MDQVLSGSLSTVTTGLYRPPPYPTVTRPATSGGNVLRCRTYNMLHEAGGRRHCLCNSARVRFKRLQAILNALEIYDNLKENGTLAPKRRPEDFGPGDGPK
jgi:hypothetical protein